MASSIIEKVGGFSKVRAVVSEFYDRILDSETLSPYFADTDMRSLIDHQTKFIAQVMGGPASYNDELLQRVHAPLSISKADFVEMANILRETLEDMDFDDDDIDKVIKVIVNHEAHIVARKN